MLFRQFTVVAALHYLVVLFDLNSGLFDFILASEQAVGLVQDGLIVHILLGDKMHWQGKLFHCQTPDMKTVCLLYIFNQTQVNHDRVIIQIQWQCCIKTINKMSFKKIRLVELQCHNSNLPSKQNKYLS